MKNEPMEQPITALQTPDGGWLLHRFIDVNFSNLNGQQPNFQDRLCLTSLSLQYFITIYWLHKFFAPYELSITTIYSMVKASIVHIP